MAVNTLRALRRRRDHVIFASYVKWHVYTDTPLSLYGEGALTPSKNWLKILALKWA